MTSDRKSKPFIRKDEVVWLGTSCEKLKETFRAVEGYCKEYKIAFVDGDHDSSEAKGFGTIVFNEEGLSTFHLNVQAQLATQRFFSNIVDGMVVNGQHFEGAAQIIFCDEKKIESVRKRLDQLTNVIALYCPNEQEPNDMYFELIGRRDIPVIHGAEEMAAFLQDYWGLQSSLRMLILAGGKSTRMGEDKAFIAYHKKPQWQYLRDIGRELGLDVAVSCRPDQSSNFDHCEIITDAIDSSGPAVGIYSAMKKHPHAHWLVVACDMPLIRKEDVVTLISERSAQHFATAYYNLEKQWAEPLFSIWEPQCRMILWNALESGKACPRELLNQLHPKAIEPQSQRVLLNVNFPSEKEEIDRLIKELK